MLCVCYHVQSYFIALEGSVIINMTKSSFILQIGINNDGHLMKFRFGNNDQQTY